ncbi:hypothetical protein HYPSUDRAFT_431489 [Hypholoma sublateritium FD-334 SS-4]|uniref:Fungal-type protein kinase domain-containing protein n=1 Tax=Hypholoma sublateritium (strain FD-334 SS-4) TaxID=945553 RepID=A0A0D2N5T2_HYPSF|nr:hypothetical protein HYPSUDRAFT_431489 [Hypholoma sublateritium FD-334 SS-4]
MKSRMKCAFQELYDISLRPHHLQKLTYLKGTVQFMARTIRRGRLIGDQAMIPLFKRPPEISGALLTRYRGVLPDRVQRFACETPTHSPGLIETPSNTIARHALRHDAESVYWVLVWWAVCVAPAGKDSTPVPTLLWDILTGSNHDFRPPQIGDGQLDPSYGAVRELLNSLASYLDPDHHWANAAPFDHPEFLHEVFQRLILNFLVDNKDEVFMLLPTAGRSRESEKPVHHAEPGRSRHQHLLDTSSAGGSSLKRPASSQDELEVSPMFSRANGSVYS